MSTGVAGINIGRQNSLDKPCKLTSRWVLSKGPVVKQRIATEPWCFSVRLGVGVHRFKRLQVAGCRLSVVATKQCTSDFFSSLSAQAIHQSRGQGRMLQRSVVLVPYHWRHWILVGGGQVPGGGPRVLEESGAAEALDDSPPPLPKASICLQRQHHPGWLAARENKVQLLPLPHPNRPTRSFWRPRRETLPHSISSSTATVTVTATTTTTITRLVRT